MNAAPATPDAMDAPFAEEDCRPQVMLPRSGMPTWVMAAMAGTLGTVVLLGLNAQPRLRLATLDDQRYAAARTPPLPHSLDRDPGRALGLAAIDASVPADGPFRHGAAPQDDAAFARPMAYAPTAMPGLAPFSDRAAAMGGAPRGTEGAPTHAAFPTTPMPGAPVAPGAGTATIIGTGGSALVYDAGRPADGGAGNDRIAGDGGARASLIRNRAMIVAQGEVLAATLETPVNSLRPGPIRAIVARDVRGFDGSRVLIPRGSRLIGEYRADPASGRRRVLATWTRLIRPDGVAIRIDSPAADALGGTGMPGKVDTHFLARFLNATLQSALQVGVNLAARRGDGSVIVTNSPQLSSTVGPTIIPGADEAPTVSVRPGAAISVFVARDLDFSGTPSVR
ncbi:TrbI/VirB10 family protein [Sphingomonas sp. CROZ-RG-20F-R02-07]|uniref:TrbI/VirB10 family protein n=1 Tax=Sphingomonas sp. CROZ-RG-20F-R02-07 TaxID=2914832 RepID=UPI001F5AC5E7|nr:TrbI/VirB10 family protein [Sphingomonas sp. CROZ-RG-20F-R02-07]